MRSTGKYCAQRNLLLWTEHNYEYKYQNVFLKYEMTFVVCILDKNVPLNQISSQKIVVVKIQPLIAIIQANLMFTKPLLG